MHRHVPFDPAASDTANMNKLVEQVHADGEHMLILKAAIERLHEVQQGHAADILHNSRRGDEQVLLNRRLLGDIATVSGTCRGVAEAHRDELQACRDLIYAKEKDLLNVVEGKLMNVAEEINKLQAVATTQHQASEEMGAYLGSLVGERPAEGKVIKGAFEHFASEINVLKIAVERLRSHGASSSISAPVTTGAQTSAIEQLSEHVATLAVRITSITGASQTMEANLNLVQGQVVSMAASLAGGGGVGCTCGSQSQEIAEMKTQLSVMTAGNRLDGSCHCIHVTYLHDRLVDLEAMVARMRTPGGGHTSEGTRPPHAYEAGRAETSPDTPQEWNMFSPLRERSLGMMCGAPPYKQLMDDKLMSNADYMFDGNKGGKAWQKLLSGYLVSKVPAALDILKWAERHDQTVVTDAAFTSVVSHFMEAPQREHLNNALWGFLNGCLRGTAKTMFEEADDLNGLDGWRRVVRTIDVNLPQRLEELRIEVRCLTSKHMKELEHIPAGIAHFQSTLKEFKDAGGLGYTSSQEMKSDLLSILPKVIREDQSILRDALNNTLEFETFKNTVVQQAARLLFERRRGGGGLHTVEPERPPVKPSDEDDFDDHFDQNGTFVGAFNRFTGQKRPGNAGPRRAPPNRQDRGGGGQARTGRPRLCPNCSKEHPGPCKEQAVDYKDRKCFICGEKHLARDCPKKEQKPVKAIEDRQPVGQIQFGDCSLVVSEPSGGSARARGRPRPKATTLMDFMPTSVQNRFDMLSIGAVTEADESNVPAQLPQPCGPVPASPWPVLTATRKDKQKTRFATTTCSSGCDCSAQSTMTVPEAKIGFGNAKAKGGPLHGRDDAQDLLSENLSLKRTPPRTSEPEQSGFWSNERVEEINRVMQGETTGKMWTNKEADEIIREAVESIFEQKEYKDLDSKRKAVDACLVRLQVVNEEFKEIDQIIKAEEAIDLLVQDDEDDGLLGDLEEIVRRVQVAMDSGACRHVINPEDLPPGAVPAGNPTGKVFHGANNSPIRRYGKVVTAMRNTSTTQGPVAVPWEAADVSRPLNSVSQTAGPKDGPGLQDVLFNNKTCYVVPPGTVERIMKEIKAIAEYPRNGDLYVADMELSSFQRQVAGQ